MFFEPIARQRSAPGAILIHTCNHTWQTKPVFKELDIDLPGYGNKSWKLTGHITAIQFIADNAKRPTTSKQAAIYKITFSNTEKLACGSLCTHDRFAEKRPLSVKADSEQTIFLFSINSFPAIYGCKNGT